MSGVCRNERMRPYDKKDCLVSKKEWERLRAESDYWIDFAQAVGVTLSGWSGFSGAPFIIEDQRGVWELTGAQRDLIMSAIEGVKAI